MVATVKIESFDVNVATASSTTHTLTNSVGNLSDGFVRRNSSIDKQSGPTGSTANANANISCGAAYLSGVSTVSFRQNSTTSQKIRGEVWRYTGSSGGPDEFIVRGRHTISLGAGTASGSTAVSGIVDTDKCIPFWTGCTQTANTTSDYDASTVSVYIDASDNIQVQRGATTGTLVVYVTVVEFTGANWSVGHARSTSHDTSDATVTMNTSSTGTGGSTFSVSSWNQATIVEASLEGDTSETGLSDNLGAWVPGTSTSTVDFLLHQDSNARNDGVAYAHILEHPGLDVNRSSNTNWAEGNGADASVTWPSGASTTSSLDELAIEWFCDTTGTGTAHARGRCSPVITAASGTMTAWVHRSGNNVGIWYGVIDFTNVDGTAYIVITDVDTDEVIGNTQANVVVTSLGGFEATQGTGKVELVQNSDYSGTIVNQTSIDSWSDTSIQFDVAAGALADTHCYLFVTNDSGESGSIAVQVGNPPETYSEAVEALTPLANHHWPMQNSYVDTVGSATMNNTSGGTPSFETKVIVKGDTHSFLLDATGDYVSPADQADMNVTVQANRRYIGGWIQVDRVSLALAVLYEEGAQINNFALLNGFGNNLMFQFADDGGDYVQIYADVPITPNRPYLVLAEFNASGQKSGQCKLWLDGVAQSRSNGNPWEVTSFPTHSGNITWGHEGSEVLQIGDSRGTDQTDIAFTSPVKCNYAHWFNWTDVTIADADIREELFEKGALADTTISSGTEAAMQTSIDAEANTLFTDWPCAIEIAACTAGSFELTFDNITFEDRVSMQVRYLGSDTLTIVTENGTVLDSAKLGAPYGGTITVINAVPITITARDIDDNSVIQGARVRITADTGGPETAGTVLLEGVTNASGVLTGNYRYSSSQPVVGRVRKGSASTYYKTADIVATVGSGGLSQTVFMIKDE